MAFKRFLEQIDYSKLRKGKKLEDRAHKLTTITKLQKTFTKPGGIGVVKSPIQQVANKKQLAMISTEATLSSAKKFQKNAMKRAARRERAAETRGAPKSDQRQRTITKHSLERRKGGPGTIKSGTNSWRENKHARLDNGRFA